MIRSRESLCKHLERGGKVRCELRHEPEPKTIWTDAESGEVVHGTAMRWAISEGKARALSDGLFPDVAQTFVAA